MNIYVNARFLTQPISGVQRYGIECSKQIKQIYPKVKFITSKNVIHTDLASELDVIETGRHTGHRWEQTELPAYVKKNGGGPLLNLANSAPLLYNNNYVTIHDLAFHHHPEWNSRAFSAWYNFMVPRIARRARQIFTVSETIKSEIIHHYHIAPERITVTYNGLARQWTDHPPKLTAKKKHILSVGTFNKRKNQLNLVRAFMQSELKNDYSLILVGDRNKIFSESGLDERVIEKSHVKILENVGEDELREQYEAAEIVVSLSGYEGFGIPMLEGLYFGCRLLCSDIPVYRELYEGLAFYCNPEDINNVAGVLAQMVVAPKEVNLESMADAFRKYSYENAARLIMEQVTSRLR